MKRLFLVLLLVFGFSSAETFSQVTRNYEAVVTFASGPHSAAFPAGERVAVTYTLDETATDSESDPQRGVFDNAVLSLSVNFPGLAVHANAGPAGRAQTFNNVPDSSGTLSDQVFFFGGPITSASSLGGESISEIEVDFLSEFVSPPNEPSMLSSDALPLSQLPMTDSFVLIRTASGTTFVHFGPPPPVTVSYDDTVVISANGPLAALFPAGERVDVTYVLDPGVPDSNSDPSRGLFDHPVLSLSVNFPGLALFANAGPAGRAQTFDNVTAASGARSDQVFLFGGPISSASSLNGESISGIEVDFLSNFLLPPLVPAMLSSDALPLSRLRTHNAFVTFRTSSGTTFVRFAPPAPDRIQLLIEDVEALVDAGLLATARGEQLIRRLEEAIDRLDRGRTAQACNKLEAFVDTVNEFVAAGRLSMDQGRSLTEPAQSIRDQLGC